MNDRDVPGWVHRLAQQARDAVGNPNRAEGWERGLIGSLQDAVAAGLCDLAGVTESRRGVLTSTVVTQDLVKELDEAQYRLGQGPCVEAAYREDILSSQDLRSESRWPEWAPEAVNRGVNAVMGIHLFTSTEVLGALNLYFHQPQVFTTTMVEQARLIGTNVSLLMAFHRKTDDLWTAIDARHRIGVAQGMLMGQFGFDLDQSFQVLRRLAGQTQRKIALIAADIIEAGGLPSRYTQSDLPT